MALTAPRVKSKLLSLTFKAPANLSAFTSSHPLSTVWSAPTKPTFVTSRILHPSPVPLLAPSLPLVCLQTFSSHPSRPSLCHPHPLPAALTAPSSMPWKADVQTFLAQNIVKTSLWVVPWMPGVTYRETGMLRRAGSELCALR